MAGAHVEFTGDASGAAAASAAAQAAIDAVHGKTETVTINVKVNQTGDMGAASRAADGHAQSADRAAAASRNHARESDSAASSVRNHARAADQAAGASDRAAAADRGWAAASEQAAGAARNHAAATDRASSAARNHAASSRDASSAVRDLGADVESARRQVDALGQRMSRGLSIGPTGMGGLHRELTAANQAMRELESGSTATMRAIESSAARAAVAVRAAQSSGGSGGGRRAIESGIIDLQQRSDGSWGDSSSPHTWAMSPPRAIGSGRSSGGGSTGSPGAFSWAGADPGDISYTGPQPRAARAQRTGAARIMADRGIGGIGSGETSNPLGGGYNGVGAARILADHNSVKDSASDTAKSVGDVGRTLSSIGGSAGSAGTSVGMTAGKFNSLAGMAANAVGPVSTFGMAATYAAAGSGLLTAGVGALGAVGVGALGGVGVAAGVAGGAMANFAVGAHQDSAKFGKTFESLGKQAHLGAQMISEPMAGAVASLGRSMVTADGQLTPLGMNIANSLQEGFGNAAGTITGSSEAIAAAGMLGASGFARLTGEAAPGVAAFLGELPSLTAGAVSGMSQITSEFGQSAGAIEGATPAINRMVGSLGGLGAQLVRTGAGSIVPFSENVGSMANGLSNMTSDLGPAIKPSMQAVTDVVNAASGGIGSLAPDIAAFAGTVSANAPQLESILGSAGRGMLSFGSAAVEGLGMAAPQISGMADSIQRNQGGLANLTGGLVGGAADVIGLGADLFGGLGNEMAGADGSVMGYGQRAGTASGNWMQNAIGSTNEGLNRAGISMGMKDIRHGGQGKGLFGESASNAPPASTPSSVGPATSAATGLPGPAPPAPGSPGQAMAARLAAPPVSTAGGDGAALIAGLTANPMAPMVSAAQSSLATLPTATNTAMAGARSEVAGANLGGAVQPQMQAMSGAISGANLAGPAGGQMSSVQRTVENAAPANAAAGNKSGGAIGTGMAAGTQSSMTIVDTLVINRMTQVHENANAALETRSPSKKFEKTGQSTGDGMLLGVNKSFKSPLAATTSLMDEMSAETERRRNDTVLTSKGGGVMRTPQAAQAAVQQGPRGALRGAEKQRAFQDASLSNSDAPRMVFDKQVMSWQAPEGVDISKMGRDELNKTIKSPLDARQQKAMESVQARIDGPVNDNYRMYYERTQQNIMRNRPGAFAVAEAKDEHEKQQKDQAAKLKPAGGYNPFANVADDAKKLGETVGGSGGAGSSGLNKNKIAMIRQASGLGKDVVGGYSKGINDNANAAVIPIGNLAKRQQKRYTDDWGISSPSTVAAGHSGNIVDGYAGGLAGNASTATDAMGNVSAAMQGVASDSGLKIGYSWGRNVVTGADAVFKKADFQGVGTPSLDNKQVEAALGSARLLGPVTGSASVYKTPAVDSGSMVGAIAQAVASAVAAQPIQVGVSLDGNPFYQMIVEAQNRLIEMWTEHAAA